MIQLKDKKMKEMLEYGKKHWKPLLIGVFIGAFLQQLLILLLLFLAGWGLVKLRERNLKKRGESNGINQTSAH